MLHTFLEGACGVHWTHVPINVISVFFKDSHFEFRINQELTKSHMDISVSTLDSSSKTTWVHWTHVPINVISVFFKDSHFEFRINQELTKSHMDISVSTLDSSSKTTCCFG